VHLSERERYKIEGLLEGKKEVEEIAVIFKTRSIDNLSGNQSVGRLGGYKMILERMNNTELIRRRQIITGEGGIRSVR